MNTIPEKPGFPKWAFFLAGFCFCVLLLAGFSSPLSFASNAQAATHHFRNALFTPTTEVLTTAVPAVKEPMKSAGCGRSAVTYNGITIDLSIPVDIAQSGGASSRLYRLHVPANYQSSQTFPLLLVFHGQGSNTREIEDFSTFSQLAEKEHFIVTYLQGLSDKLDETFWNTSGSPTETINDLHFVSRVLDELQTKYCLDTRRIYAAGFSNGASMVGLLACKMATRITAIAPIGGYYFDAQNGCKPARPVPIINAHGSADEVVPYDNVVSDETASSTQGIQQWLSEWSIRDGCAEGPTNFVQTPQFRGTQWTTCYDRTSVVHYRIEDGRHVWPSKLGELSTAEVLWQFMKDHSLPRTD